MLCSHGSRATHEFASSYFGISAQRTTIPCHLPPMASRTPSLSAAVPHKRFPGTLFSRPAWKRLQDVWGYKKALFKRRRRSRKTMKRCKIERAIFVCFLKWWYPQNTPKWSFLLGKHPIRCWGNPPFRETPIQRLMATHHMHRSTQSSLPIGWQVGAVCGATFVSRLWRYLRDH